eukprot:COSAG01_NODE_2293_length_7967_cov_83.137646_4_plen_903_part_00
MCDLSTRPSVRSCVLCRPQAFFSAVLSGASGLYIITLATSPSISTHLTIQPGQNVQISADSLQLAAPPAWGSGGFSVAERGKLALTYVTVAGGIYAAMGASGLVLSQCVLQDVRLTMAGARVSIGSSSGTLSGVTMTGGTLTMDAGSSIAFSGTMSLANAGRVALTGKTFSDARVTVGAGSDLDITSCSGTLSGVTMTGGTLTMDAGSSIAFSGTMSLANAGRVALAGKTFSSSAYVTVGAGSDLDITGCSGTLSGVTMTGGTLTMDAASPVALSGRVSLSTSASVALRGQQFSNAQLAVNSGSAANITGCSGTLSGVSVAGGTLTVDAASPAAFRVDATRTYIAGRYRFISISVTGGTLAMVGANVTGEVTVTGAGHVALTGQTFSSRAYVTVGAGSDLDITGCNGTLSGVTMTGGTLTMDAASPVALSGRVSLSTSASVALRGQQFSNAQLAVNSGSAANITGCSGTLSGVSVAGGTLTVDAASPAAFRVDATRTYIAGRYRYISISVTGGTLAMVGANVTGEVTVTGGAHALLERSAVSRDLGVYGANSSAELRATTLATYPQAGAVSATLVVDASGVYQQTPPAPYLGWMGAALGGACTTLSDHTSSVWALAYIPDQRLLASGSADASVKLWTVDGARRSLLTTLTNHTSDVAALAYIPDQRLLASGSYDHSVKLWTVDGARRSLLTTLSGHSSSVLALAYIPDQRLLASGSGDYSVKLWTVDGARSSLLTTLSGHSGYVWALTYIADQRLLASGSGDHNVKLWTVDGARSSLLTTLSGHSSVVYALAYIPDQRLLASGSGDHNVKLWTVDGARSSLLTTLSGHSGYVYALAYIPDQRLLASGLYDYSVKLWTVDGARSSLLTTLSGHSGYVRALAYIPDQRLLASGSYDYSVKLWTV